MTPQFLLISAKAALSSYVNTTSSAYVATLQYLIFSTCVSVAGKDGNILDKVWFLNYILESFFGSTVLNLMCYSKIKIYETVMIS